MNLGTYPKCNDSRRCFAKQIGYVNEKKVVKCSVLCSSYKLDGECTFCKPDAESQMARDIRIIRRMEERGQNQVQNDCKKIRCSWCGKPIRTEDLEKVKEKHADFRYFCRFCNTTRYMRESDIFGENRR